MWLAVWQPTPKRLMSPSPNRRLCSHLHSYESVIFLNFGINSFHATATLLNMSLSPARTDAADGGCGGGLHFAPMHAIRSVGQCDVNIPSLSPRGSRSKAVANDYRREYKHRCGLRTLVITINNHTISIN